MKSLRIEFAAIAFFVLSVVAHAEQPTFSNLDYVGKGNTKQYLDLYIPTGVSTPTPLIIYIHGGAWTSGAKGNSMGFCDTLLMNGYAVADINYRLIGDSIFPAQIYDCKAAVRWLKSHAQQYNLDTCRVAVTGSSAGGHLAMLLGTSGGVTSLEDMLQGSASASSTVHAAIPFYGASDFMHIQSHIPRTPPDSCRNPLDHTAPGSPEARLLGCAQMMDCPDKMRQASPNTYVDSNDPPFSLLHGSFDCTVPPHQSVLMDSALKAVGVFSTLLILPGVVHGFRPDPMQKLDMLTFLSTKMVPASCAPTGVEGEVGQLPSFTVRPIPVFDRLLISNLDVSLARFTIVNVLGVTVVSAALTSNEVDVSDLPSGMYFISIESATSIQTQKFLKH